MGQAYSAPLVRVIPSTLRQLIMHMQNARSAGIDECIVRLEKKGIVVPEPVKKNLTALAEVRDNAVHFINVSPQLSKQVLEVGTACRRNFIEIGKHLWWAF